MKVIKGEEDKIRQVEDWLDNIPSDDEWMALYQKVRKLWSEPWPEMPEVPDERMKQFFLNVMKYELPCDDPYYEGDPWRVYRLYVSVYEDKYGSIK
jgi:hypothetical protein